MNDPKDHPLYPIFLSAIEQAMFGKGTRHGGAVTPFLEQPWNHYGKLHGRGFLTGQAAKKLEEAASLREGVAFETEMFGAMVYIGMSILHERAKTQEAIKATTQPAPQDKRSPPPFPARQAQTPPQDSYLPSDYFRTTGEPSPLRMIPPAGGA